MTTNKKHDKTLKGFVEKASWATPAYLILAFASLAGGFMLLGTEIFPKTDAGQAQVRLRLPAGTRVARCSNQFAFQNWNNTG